MQPKQQDESVPGQFQSFAKACDRVSDTISRTPTFSLVSTNSENFTKAHGRTVVTKSLFFSRSIYNNVITKKLVAHKNIDSSYHRELLS